MAEKNKTTVSKIIGEVTAMLIGIMAVLFALCFCAVFQESRIRERQYKEHGIAAYFKTEFDQTYEIRSSEIFIGTGKNADIRIHIPGVDRKKNRWWGQRRLAGIKELHAYAELKDDGQFYIRNLSKRFPIYMEFGEERRRIRSKDGEVKLYHGAKLIFGGCRLTFYRGTV